LIRQITKGDWEVRSFDGVDEKNGFVYFSGMENSPIAEQIYRVKLDGSGMTRLTKLEGSNRAMFNPTFTHFVNVWSDINTPPQTALHRADGTVEKVINANKVELLDEYNLSKPEFMKVKNRDGFEMEAYMIKPPNFDSSKKYPVLSFVYGGPHAPQVRDSWGGSRYMYHQMLAQKGYIIWVCDPRAASGKGEKETWTAYKELGVTEQLDIEDGVKFLKTQSYVDPNRIGIWGWSYGGYMTLFALTHSKSFKIGVSVAPVTDYALYDSIYTERYMLTPQNNPQGYAKTDLNSKAKDLHGKLLLVHGIMDNNVHMQNTTKFVYALQKNGIQFDFMAYPTQRHGISDRDQTYHLYNMMANFIMENL
jgi:dipeptidyl-peptidase-4